MASQVPTLPRQVFVSLLVTTRRPPKILSKKSLTVARSPYPPMVREHGKCRYLDAISIGTEAFLENLSNCTRD
eukprot:scaffold7412_cov115-Cylindrotheca_fusiformis.AAC.8